MRFACDKMCNHVLPKNFVHTGCYVGMGQCLAYNAWYVHDFN